MGGCYLAVHAAVRAASEQHVTHQHGVAEQRGEKCLLGLALPEDVNRK